jgi:hypothetical protein
MPSAVTMASGTGSFGMPPREMLIWAMEPCIEVIKLLLD